MVRYLFVERVSTCREFRICIVSKSVTADGSLLSPTGGVNGIHPAPKNSRTFYDIQRLRNTAHIFTHNIDNPEHIATNCMNTTMHTDANTAQFLSTPRTVFRCIASCVHCHMWLKSRLRPRHFHPWLSTCALVLECSPLPCLSNFFLKSFFQI